MEPVWECDSDSGRGCGGKYGGVGLGCDRTQYEPSI